MDSDKEKVAKAATIMEKFEVGKALSYLINSPHIDNVDGLEWDREFKASQFPKGDRAARWTWNGKTYEFVAVDRRLTFDGDDYWSTATLAVDGETVLTTVMATSRRHEDTARGVLISPVVIKQVRLDSWIEDLKPLRDKCEEARQKAREAYQSKRLAEQASQVDLGKYG